MTHKNGVGKYRNQLIAYVILAGLYQKSTETGIQTAI